MATPETLTSGAKAATRTPVGHVLHQCRRGFWFVAMLGFVIEVVSLAPMVYMWNAYDRVLTSRSVVTLVSLTTLVLGVYAFWATMDWMRGRLLVRLSLRIDWELASDIFDASFRRQVGRKKTNVQQVLADLLELRQFLGGPGMLALMSAPYAILFIIVSALFHPYLAIFSLVSTIVMFLVGAINRRVSTTSLKASNEANAESLRLAGNVLKQSEATLALGMMPAMRRRWHQRHREFLGLQVASSEVAGVGMGVSNFLSHSFQSLGMGLGLLLAIDGIITGGMVMAVSMLIAKSVGPLRQLVTYWPMIAKARQSYDRLNELLAENQQRGEQMRLPVPVGHLMVENMTSVPDGSQNAVLSGIDFSIAPGEALAIVGPSASGKSSLSKLLVGVWRPTNGSVRLDGVELADWNHDELGPHIGYVPQEIAFFEGTVAENIARLGDVDPDKVVEAAKLIEMHDIILSWPQGYDTVLGEAGFPISGGQRQRLAIARALYGSPTYVVMDEPNANLDEVGEQALIRALRQLRERRVTVIVTTHRPRLIGIVDRMMVLKGGHQVGFGTPKDLFDAVKRNQLAAVPAPANSAALSAPSDTTGATA